MVSGTLQRFLTTGADESRKRFPGRNVLVVGLILAATTGIRWGLDPVLGESLPFLMYLPAIIIAAARGGRALGFATTVISVGLSLLWLPLTFKPSDWISLLCFVVIPLFIVFTIASLQDLAKLQQRTAAELAASREQLQRHANELEEMIKDRTAQLERTVSDLEVFSHTVAHDLRSPLRAMEGFAALIREDYGERLGEEGCRYLTRIEAAAQRMDALIQDVTGYNRVARGEARHERVELEGLIRDVMEQYPTLQAAHAQIEIERPVHNVTAAPSALAQAIANLLTNAVKFVIPGKNPSIKIWTEASGGVVRLIIQDNGIGIPEGAMSKIFEPFQRGHGDAYEGTGIGLAITRKAVERTGGKLGAESKEGEGSRFWIELPAG